MNTRTIFFGISVLLSTSALPASAGTLSCSVKYTLETPEARARNTQGDLAMPDYHTVDLRDTKPLRPGLLASANGEDGLLTAGANRLAKIPDKLSFRVTIKKLKSTGFPLV